MKKVVKIQVIVLFLISIYSCNLRNPAVSGEQSTESIATIVSQTLTALTTPTREIQSSPSAWEGFTTTPALTPSSRTELEISPTKIETPTISPTQASTITQVPKPGAISGNISGYPYGSLPRFAIVAFGQEPPYNYSYWITAPGDSTYSMTSDYLLPGNYQVVAYDSESHSGGCPAIVKVVSDQVAHCDITHWSGVYPAKPANVPNP
jgi:hypothetical protein